ncbi:MAG: SRPBCC family protein [Dehalococcoidales bacterium]|jgi:uncharacterized membrane protein
MPVVDKEIIIDAPVEEIFGYVSKPGNLPQIWPNLVEIKNEKLLPNGGYRFQWVCLLFGIKLAGKGEYVDIAPNLWLSARTYGAVESLNTWTFRSKGSQTRVTVTIDYQIPSILSNRLAENTIVKANEREADTILVNLRARYDNRTSRLNTGHSGPQFI